MQTSKHTADIGAETTRWAKLARLGLERDGYWYERKFADPARGTEATRLLAQELGQPLDDVVVTEPDSDAPSWRPFDQRMALGWHGDFCTHNERASLSMSFIERGDPRGSPWGDWRVATVARVIETMESTERGRRAIRELSDRDAPFAFDGEIFRFRVLASYDSQPILRFYGTGLREGIASAMADEVTLLDAVTALEQAADACAVHFAATAGAVLVVHNWRALHYRNEQTVGVAQPRRAVLMFVRRAVGGATAAERVASIPESAL